MFKLYENRFTGSEDTLVKSFIEKYKDQELDFGNTWVKGKYYEQVRIREINRISDLIVRCGDSRLINIEFKLGDWHCVLQQAIDHLKWCDYSYVCVPVNYLRVFPQRFCNELLDKRIGLIVGTSQTFFEVFRAKHNTYKAGKSKELRLKVLNHLKIKDQVQVALY